MMPALIAIFVMFERAIWRINVGIAFLNALSVWLKRNLFPFLGPFDFMEFAPIWHNTFRWHGYMYYNAAFRKFSHDEVTFRSALAYCQLTIIIRLHDEQLALFDFASS